MQTGKQHTLNGLPIIANENCEWEIEIQKWIRKSNNIRDKVYGLVGPILDKAKKTDKICGNINK